MNCVQLVALSVVAEIKKRNIGFYWFEDIMMASELFGGEWWLLFGQVMTAAIKTIFEGPHLLHSVVLLLASPYEYIVQLIRNIKCGGCNFYCFIHFAI